MTDGVDAEMQAMKPPPYDATLHRAAAKTEGDQLMVCDDAVLSLRQNRDLHIGWSI
jgi:hypothetical protein